MQKLAILVFGGDIGTNIDTFIPPFLVINNEIALQREVKDIIDELDVMIHICFQQKGIIRKFTNSVAKLLEPQEIRKPAKPKASPILPFPTSPFFPTSPTSHITLPTSPGTSIDYQKAKEIRSYNQRWFMKTSQELLGSVDDRIAELQGLRKSAESASNSVCPRLIDPSTSLLLFLFSA